MRSIFNKFTVKRPAFVLAAAVAVTALLGAALKLWIYFILVIAAAVGAVYFAVKKRRLHFIAAALCFITAANAGFIYARSLSMASQSGGREVTVSGVVTNPPEYHGNYVVYRIKADTVDGKNCFPKVGITFADFSGITAYQGNKVKLNMALSAVTGNRLERMDYSNGIILKGSNAAVVSVQNAGNIYSFSAKIKSFVSGAAHKFLPFEEASVFTALVTGNRSSIDDGLYDSIKTSGVTHMLVVSGLHLGIICSMLLTLFSRRLSRRMAAALTLPCVVFIMTVCDFGYSVVRAGLTYLIFLLGLIILKDSDSLSSLCTAVAVTLAVRPFAVCNVAFLLSVTSTFAVIFAAPKLIKAVNSRLCTKKHTGWLKFITVPLSQTVCATAFSFPITVVFFGWVSTVAIFTNILVGFSVTAALCCGFLGLLLYAVGIIPIATYLFAAAGICIKYFCLIVRFMSGINGAAFSVTETYGAFVCVFAVIAVAVITVLCRRRIKTKTPAVICTLAMTAVFITASVLLNTATYRIAAVNTGKGQSVIVAKGQKAVIFGLGDDKKDALRICNALDYLNIKSLAKVWTADGNAVGAEILKEKYGLINIQNAVADGNIGKESSIDGINIKFTKSGGAEVVLDGYRIFISGGSASAQDTLYTDRADMVICNTEDYINLNHSGGAILTGKTPYDGALPQNVYETVNGDVTALIKWHRAIW